MDGLLHKNNNTSKTNIRLIDVFAMLIVLLFVYTAVSKLLSFGDFKYQMTIQTLPDWAASLLIWTLPGTELFAAILLLFERTRFAGFVLSFFLMFLFTAYISLVLLNYFGRVPCSCGGVLKAMGWKIHLFFNIFFLLLSASGIYLINRERRLVGKD